MMRRLRRRRYLLILAVVLVIALSGTEAALILRGTGGKKTESSSTTSTTSRTRTVMTSSTVETSSTSQVTTQPTEAKYVTSSPINTSQLFVIESNRLPAFVYSNNTGAIPEYSSLALLNESKIGVFCDLVNQTSGVCLQFKMFEETGWFWDSSHDILYIKYVGGPAVELIVSDNTTRD
jgi:hypothetical protein